MTSIFISHSTVDAPVALQLKTWLGTKGYRLVFIDYDPNEGIRAGGSWESELYKLLRTCSAVIVLCSRNSENSKWVFAEITLARSMGKTILPIQLDDSVLTLLSDTQSVNAKSGWEDAHDQLSEAFARAGLEPLVTSIEAYQSCFISYSSDDQDFAEKIYQDLTGTGVQCWFAPHDIRGGKKIHEQIEEAILEHDRVLLVLSQSSMTSSWVQTEISTARQRETSQRTRVLFPIRLVEFEILKNWQCFDADVGKDSAREIREYFIPNFSEWYNPNSYKLALQDLIRDLQEET